MNHAILFVSRHFRLVAGLVLAWMLADRYHGLISGDLQVGGRAWLITQYLVNYIDFGFARRALLGTVFYPVTHSIDDPEMAAMVELLAVFVVLAAVAILVFDRAIPHRPIVASCDAPGDGIGAQADFSHAIRAACAIGALGVVQIGFDHGRYDLLNYLLLTLAVLLTLRGHNWWTGVVAAIGILNHEAFAVFAMPLILAIAARNARNPRAVVACLAPVLALALPAALAVFLFGNSQAAAEMGIGDGGGVWRRSLIRFNDGLALWQVAVLASFWAALIGILYAFYRANRARLDGMFLAALSPVFLNVLGTDDARWVAIGFVVAVVCIAVQVRAFGMRYPKLAGGARWAFALLILPLGPIGIDGLLPRLGTWIF